MTKRGSLTEAVAVDDVVGLLDERVDRALAVGVRGVCWLVLQTRTKGPTGKGRAKASGGQGRGGSREVGVKRKRISRLGGHMFVQRLQDMRHKTKEEQKNISGFETPKLKLPHRLKLRSAAPVNQNL